MTAISQNSSAPNVTATVRRVTFVGLVINLLLSFLKVFLGRIGNSQAVVADGIHSLSDCITDVVVIAGVHFWTQPPDKEHPYGHHRIETLVSAAVGVALFGAALAIGWNAIADIGSPDKSPPGVMALGAAILSIISKELLYQYTRRAGQSVRSIALQANAWHHRTDAMSSIPVALAVGGGLLWPTLPHLDQLGALVVSGFIIKAAFDIVKSSLTQLTDAAVDEPTLAQASKVAMETEGVLDAHRIRTRKAGSDIFIDMHILVDRKLTIEAGHDIATSVQRALKQANPDICDVLVHVEPYPAQAHHRA